MDVLDVIAKIFGTFLFFLPGFLLSHFLFPRTSFLARTTFSLIISFFSGMMLGIILARCSLLMPCYTSAVIGIWNIFLIMVFFLKWKRTSFVTLPPDRFFWLLFLLIILGVSARLFFLSHIHHFGDGITSHVDYIIGRNLRRKWSTSFHVPFIHFYSGMLWDRMNFVGDAILLNVFSDLSFNQAFFKALWALWMLCGMSFIVIEAFTNNKMWAFVGSAIMAIGPTEILHTSLDFLTPLPAYLAVMTLFLFYRREERGYLWLTLLFALQLMFSYYTGALVMILTSLGFILSMIIRHLVDHKGLAQKPVHLFLQACRQKKVLVFFLVVMILSSYLLLFSTKRISVFTTRNLRGLLRRAVIFKQYPGSSTIPRPVKPYKSRFRFLGFPLITWHDFFLILLLMSFWIHYYKKRNPNDRDVAYAFIPAVMQSLCFVGVNLSERTFSYLTFFAILSARIPRRISKHLMIGALSLLVPTTALIAKERIQFFHNAEGEIAAAKWVKKNLKSILLGDERFMSLLVENGFYQVAGFPDNSPYITYLYYSQDPKPARQIFARMNIRYFATTQRMRQQHILLLSFPQEPMTNLEMYEKYFFKIFDNGDVKIYDIKRPLPSSPL